MKHETAGDVLATEDAAVFLRPLTSTTSGDTTTSWTAIGRTSLVHGDYGFFRHATFDELRAHLAEASRDVRLGVWLEGKLIGRIDLNPINPPRWVLGYWLDERLTEKGLMTMACRAAIGHARALGALELYAGVTDGNERSVRLLQRLEFEQIQDVDGRSRWRLPMTPDAPPPFMVTAEESA